MRRGVPCCRNWTMPRSRSLQAERVRTYCSQRYAAKSGYRTRIRTPSFAHMQMLPLMCRGRTIPDLFAVLGAMDYVLADVDR
ncbi:MAG: hypothetical protein WAM39_28505 [Bryobacteraceae bacterium]